MALSNADTQHLKVLLQDLPLAQEAPGFLYDLAAYMTRRDVARGDVIFEPSNPESPIGRMYLLADGALSQSMGASGQPWYLKELKPGEFFGQRSLVSGRHDSRVVATAPSIVYEVAAPDLSLVLDRYPAFRDVLWKESRAGRLRSIPLFESLNDGEIGWLAELVDEVTLPAGAAVPLAERPGLWLVDWGQAAVTGPAASVAGGAAEWPVTAGNFFLTLQPGLAFGASSAAATARTLRNSHFFYLAERHYNRLLAALPAVKRMTDAPLDIPAWLRDVPLFSGSGMDEAHRLNLAGLCAWAFVPANQNVSTQGTVGYSWVELLKGGLMITAVDDRGRSRPVQILQPGQSFGETSLLASKSRDATARAVPGPAQFGQPALNGAEILNLDRRDLQVAFEERPDLWHSGVDLFDRYRQVTAVLPSYPWLEEGEHVYWTGRRHWWWLVAPLLFEFLALAITFAGIIFVAGLLGTSMQGVLLMFLLVGALIFLPIVLYTYKNYLNDYYVVTNRRATRHDQVLFARESRLDSPLESVQDVTSFAGLWGRIWDYGNVTIRTAAKVGSMVFEAVRDPDYVQEQVTLAKAQAATAQRGYYKESLRRGLMSDLKLATAIPDIDSLRALGENVVPQPPPSAWQRFTRALGFGRPQQVPVRRARPFAWVRNLVPAGWRDVLFGPPPPPPKPISLSGGEVVWRKHWVNLLQRSLWAWLFTAFILIVGLMLLLGGSAFGDTLGIVAVLWLIGFAGALFWDWYTYVDWQNDLYIVNDDQIIDVEQKPLALSTSQRASSLEVIQTMDTRQPSIWSKIFNYGDVHIRTAATDEGFVFRMVPAPMMVQKAIFQRMDAYRRRQEERRLEERRRSVVEGLQAYHELQQDHQRTL